MEKIMFDRVKPQNSELMTISDIARLAATSWHFAKLMTADKKFPKPKKIGKSNYWIKSEVSKYLKV